MKTKRISTATLKGLKQAERLHTSGKYEKPIIDKDYRDVLIFIPKNNMTYSRKTIAIISILIFLSLYLTGIFQLAIFGDFTYRFGKTFNMQEDDKRANDLFEARWKVIHIIDSL
jgi:hypothetical protein